MQLEAFRRPSKSSMSLSARDINFLLSVLNEDTCGSAVTFEQIAHDFQRTIAKADYLRVGNALVLLLQNRDLTPTPAQRLIIIYLFVEMYKSDVQTVHDHPFAPVFLSFLQSNGEPHSKFPKYFHWIISPVTRHERSFVGLLLRNVSVKDVSKKTPNQFLQSELSPNDELVQRELQQQLKETARERKQQTPALVQCHLPALVNDPEVNHYGYDVVLNGPNHRLANSRQTIEQLLTNNVMEQTIHPEYLRLVPPLHECTIDELAWLSPITDADVDALPFVWDESMCLSAGVHSEVRALFEKAYQGAINLQQQQKILDELKNDPELVHHLGLTPQKLPLLVENNPSISISCLLKLITSSHMTEYLHALVHMNMSLHSMEVVNRLSTSMDLPREFLHLYISTCIKTCDETKDKYLQSRFVRLVSVFIQSLIRNKAIDIKDLFLDVQEFCLAFRHIKEASALFQLLKTFDLRPDEHAESTTLAAGNDE